MHVKQTGYVGLADARTSITAPHLSPSMNLDAVVAALHVGGKS